MQKVCLRTQMRSFKMIAIIGFAMLLILNGNLKRPDGSNGLLASADKKGVDLLFLKDKFILKDKKGSIVIADDKKCCECPHYHHY